jgi:protein disulfide-isomerase
MKQKGIILLISILCFSYNSFAQTKEATTGGGLEWHTDMLKANEISQKSNKPIFAFFTGSDWCGWCKKLQRDVFVKQEFIQWAKSNVVLLELDFPRTKQLSPELKEQNQNLQQTFQVQGYPTIWMFYMVKDEATQKFNINALGSLGYPSGSEPGKEQVKFLNDANTILEKGKTKQ